MKHTIFVCFLVVYDDDENGKVQKKLHFRDSIWVKRRAKNACSTDDNICTKTSVKGDEERGRKRNHASKSTFSTKSGNGEQNQQHLFFDREGAAASQLIIAINQFKKP